VVKTEPDSSTTARGLRGAELAAAPGCCDPPDYRPACGIYFLLSGPETAVLLCGGDKGTQDRDIERAKEPAKEDRDGT
jgi:hypothetical protein